MAESLEKKQEPTKNHSEWNLFKMMMGLWKNRLLIIQLTKREVLSRYRGSYLGVLWSVITPLIMLIIYTFVFGVILKSRWGVDPNSSTTEFALILFCGLITFNIFSEIVNQAPGLVTNNVNYVKKVVFPLEILPIVTLGSALIHTMINIVILILGLVILLGVFNWTIVFLPVVLLPLILMSLGFGWFLASLGVFLRDLKQVIGLFVTAIMFLSPIFYPLSIIPVEYQQYYYLNPITYVVEDMRGIMVWGKLPDLQWLLTGTFIGGVIAVVGYAWFQKTRGGFADVL